MLSLVYGIVGKWSASIPFGAPLSNNPTSRLLIGNCHVARDRRVLQRIHLRYIGLGQMAMDDPHKIEAAQRAFCVERNAQFLTAPSESKLGLALVTEGSRPMNGLRHPPAGETNGWDIWFGEDPSTAPDFFAPLHTAHVYERYPDPFARLALLLGTASLWMEVTSTFGSTLRS